MSGLVADEGRLAHRATHLTRKKTPKPLSRAATENQAVGFVCDLLQAPPTAVGTIAAGLEASSLLVVRGAREARRRRRLQRSLRCQVADALLDLLDERLDGEPQPASGASSEAR